MIRTASPGSVNARTAWQIAKSVFDALGAKTYVMSDEPDGYNINTDCGSTHIEHLQQFVLGNRLDIGFAYDGDADRCLCVDEKGNVVTGAFCGGQRPLMRFPAAVVRSKTAARKQLT